MDADLSHYPLRDYVAYTDELRSIVRSYEKEGMRNSKAAAHDKLGKHMMHLVRLYLMCLDLLEKGQIKKIKGEDK